jgi:hypothetical protein
MAMTLCRRCGRDEDECICYNELPEDDNEDLDDDEDDEDFDDDWGLLDDEEDDFADEVDRMKRDHGQERST